MLDRCSLRCIDNQYEKRYLKNRIFTHSNRTEKLSMKAAYSKRICFRMGTFYPNDTKSTFNATTDCPPYWRNPRNRITINPVNFTSEEYMDNIQVSAYIGMGINILVVCIWFVSFKDKFLKIEGCWNSFRFGGKLLIKFLAPLIDSVLGKSAITVTLSLTFTSN